MSDVSWTGGGGNWDTPGDWSGGAVPTSSDTVTLSSGLPVVDSNVGTIASLDLAGSLAFTAGGALDVTGGIDVTGSASDLNISGTTSSDAVLTVGGAAGFGTAGVLSGSVELTGDGQIQFASGGITSIASGASLTLNGPLAAISNDGTDSNSALAGLTSVSGFFQLNDSATLTTSGDLTVASGGQIVLDDAASGGSNLTVGGVITDAGQIYVDAIAATSPDILSAAGVVIAPGGTLFVGVAGAAVDTTNGITFDGSATAGATLVLNATPANGSTYSQTLNNFGPHDSLNLAGMAYAAGATATLSGDTLTVTSNGVTEQFTLSSPGATTFQATDNGGGVLVSAVCFAAGTRIRTARGEVAVEDLAVGDLVVTTSGEARPIVWLGHRRLERPARDAWPVRVTAGAFGDGLPAHDLVLSPGHAVCVDVAGEVFVPVSVLINGETIAREEVAEFTYWHVELASHDVLLAEGLGCESYMDCGNRGFFGRDYGRLAEIDSQRVADSLTHYARPFVDGGAIVEAIRQRLTARAELLAGALSLCPSREDEGLRPPRVAGQHG